MSDGHVINDADSATEASRPVPDMKIGREVGEVFAHMLGDGRSIIDPEARIWTAEAAEDLRARIEDNPIIGTDQGQWVKLALHNAGCSWGLSSGLHDRQ